MGKNKTDTINQFHMYRHLRQIIHKMDSYREGIARNFGISGPSLYLLVSIHTLPECSYKDLAAYTGLPPNTVSRLVSSLITQRFISTVSDPNDRRIVHLSLTQAGNKIAEYAWEVLSEISQTEMHGECSEWILSQMEHLRDHY